LANSHAARPEPWDNAVPKKRVAGQDRRIAGQTGGRIGEQFNPFLVLGDPSRPEFEIESACHHGHLRELICQGHLGTLGF
jgi:hypothetical protein